MKPLKYLFFLSKEVIVALWELVKAVLLPVLDLIQYIKDAKKKEV